MGMAMAITVANEFGIRRGACPTAVNAGGAMAAYAARAGMESFVFMPDDTPMINLKETHLAGAQVFRVNGLINDCGRLVGEGREPMGWFDLSSCLLVTSHPADEEDRVDHRDRRHC